VRGVNYIKCLKLDLKNFWFHVGFARLSLLSLTAESRAETHISLCQMFEGPCGSGRVFSPSTSAFFSQYHSTNVPHSSSSTRCSYENETLRNPWKLPESNELWKSGNNGKKISTFKLSDFRIVQWIRRLIVSRSLQHYGMVHVGIVVYEVTMGEDFLKLLCFSLSVSLNHSLLIFIYMLV